MIVFIEKLTGRVELYGSVKTLFEQEQDFLKIGISHFYNLKMDDWKNENCEVYRREVKKFNPQKKVKKMDIPKKIAQQDHKGIIKSYEKINIQNDTYIYRNERYYIKINDTLYICIGSFEIGGQKYKLPINKIGNIENLKIT